LPKHLENVEVRFELPDGVLTPSLAAPDGRATFEAVTREVVWLIGTYLKKEPIILRGSASTEQGFDLSGRFPLLGAKFLTTGMSLSGFRVDKFEVENVTYQPFRGVKYLIKGGNSEFRTEIL
jgi:AP-3 complex subunit mu